MATVYTQINIAGDPTIWTLKNPIVDPAGITRSSTPLALDVSRPLDGILLLSVKAAAFVTLIPQSGLSPLGWIYDDLKVPSVFFYLPSVSPPPTGPALYQAPEGTTLAELQTTITTAMSSSQRVSVPFEAPGGVGQVVLNGATLPFAVIVSSMI